MRYDYTSTNYDANAAIDGRNAGMGSLVCACGFGYYARVVNLGDY